MVDTLLNAIYLRSQLYVLKYVTPYRPSVEALGRVDLQLQQHPSSSEKERYGGRH
nr:hypothetical protein Q903MT_gene3057 [Picea sitchensis]